MRIIHIVILAALVTCSTVNGEFVLIREAPRGTIQIRDTSEGITKDIFLIASKIVSVEVSSRDSSKSDDGAYVFIALDGTVGVNSARYTLHFATREEAITSANTIISKIHEEPNKSEQATPRKPSD